MTRDKLQQAGLALLVTYLIIGPGLALWTIYVQEVDFGEGVSSWIFWWALPGLAALPIFASVTVKPPKSRNHSKLFHGLVFGATALGALLAGWMLWVSFVRAPDHGDDVYRWWVAGVILMMGTLFVIVDILPYLSSEEDTPEAAREGFWKRAAPDLAGGGLMLAALAILLWAFYVDDADTSEPVYRWFLLLALAGFACWVIPWAAPNWKRICKRILVGAFMFMYTAIVFALAVDAIDGSEDWRFWTLVAVWSGTFWAVLHEAHLPVIENAIEIVLIICVFITGFALLWIIIVPGVLGNEVGSTENVLSALLSFTVEVVLPVAGMVGGLEIVKRLRYWLGVGRIPRIQLRP